MAFIVLIALGAFGALRLARNPTEMVAGVRLRIMQPSIPQDERFNFGAKSQIMSRYLALSESGDSGLRGITHLIWPESAFPFF